MNHNQRKLPLTIARHPVYRRALQNLNATLEQNSGNQSIEQIELLRIGVFGRAALELSEPDQQINAHFADVDAHEGEITLPKKG